MAIFKKVLLVFDLFLISIQCHSQSEEKKIKPVSIYNINIGFYLDSVKTSYYGSLFGGGYLAYNGPLLKGIIIALGKDEKEIIVQGEVPNEYINIETSKSIYDTTNIQPIVIEKLKNYFHLDLKDTTVMTDVWKLRWSNSPKIVLYSKQQHRAYLDKLLETYNLIGDDLILTPARIPILVQNLSVLGKMIVIDEIKDNRFYVSFNGVSRKAMKNYDEISQQLKERWGMLLIKDRIPYVKTIIKFNKVE